MNLVVGIDAGIFAGVKLLDDDTGAVVFPGFGPDGVAAFVGIERGLKLTLSWASDVRPHADGTEQRASTLDRPSQHYDGEMKLLGNLPRRIRGLLAQYAAAGAPFLLGLPYEALPLVADAQGTKLTVPAAWLAKSDWMQIGQRVIVYRGSTAITAVIQSASGSSIVIDKIAGVAGGEGGEVMPAMAIYLEPQQDFSRLRVAAESWSLGARAAIFDFCPPRATLDLQAQTGDPAMAGAVLTSTRPGLFGEYLITFANSGVATLSEAGFLTTVYFKHDVTTLGDVASMLEASSNVKLTGNYNPAAVLSFPDAFTASMQGTQASGDMGVGAVLTTYAGLPVWDRALKNAGGASDPVNAQIEIMDLGGVPYPIGQADFPVWGRSVELTSDDPDQWQWLKLFLVTVRGAQGVWWLPTMRDDFTWVSSGVLSITVRTDDDSDISAWYPRQRDRLMVRQIDGTVTYMQITAIPVDNGDGTMTVPVDATLSGIAVELVSWLEPCRFQQDTFTIEWQNGRAFSLTAPAQAHAVTDPDLGEIA